MKAQDIIINTGSITKDLMIELDSSCHNFKNITIKAKRLLIKLLCKDQPTIKNLKLHSNGIMIFNDNLNRPDQINFENCDIRFKNIYTSKTGPNKWHLKNCKVNNNKFEEDIFDFTKF